MRNDQTLEVLSDALNAVLLAGDFDMCADPRAFVRKENALVDAAIECGMKHDHTHPREWASVTVAYWLSKPITGLWAGSGYARNYSMPSLGEAA